MTYLYMENSNINDIITPSLSNNNLFTDPPSISKPTIQPLTQSPWFYIKIIFIVLFLALMGLNILRIHLLHLEYIMNESLVVDGI